MTKHHDEFLLPASDQARAIRRAYDALTDPERATVDRLADQIMQGVSTRRSFPAGLGKGGALELLAKLGIWINDHPGYASEIAERWEPDDLKPEEER